MDWKNLKPIRHYFYVDKKWPFENKQMAFSLALGFVWESAHKYTGELASPGSNFQLILRPNIEFSGSLFPTRHGQDDLFPGDRIRRNRTHIVTGRRETRRRETGKRGHIADRRFLAR